METTSTQLTANKINNFDYYYEMSDSNNTWEKGERRKEEITSELKAMSRNELIEVKTLITVEDELRDRYFEDFLQDLPEAAPVAVSFRSQIMSTAHQLFATEKFKSFGAALSASWKRYKLIEKLKTGIAYFTFKKADNSLRPAIGTLRNNNFQYDAKGSERKSNPLQVKYFDIEKRAFRSLNICRLIEIAA